jgi:hypothetical protein
MENENDTEPIDALDLFAEELPEHADYAMISTLACFSTGACSCAFSTAGTLTTKACPD